MALLGLCLLPGCGGILVSWFIPGTYSGEIPCTLRVEDESGEANEREFTASLTMTVAANRSIEINDVPVAIGEEVVRSLPEADLAFEINHISQVGNNLSIEYLPRPSLVGISVEGLLTETYQQRASSIDVTAQADLEITDVEMTILLTVTCEGTLTPQQ